MSATASTTTTSAMAPPPLYGRSCIDALIYLKAKLLSHWRPLTQPLLPLLSHGATHAPCTRCLTNTRPFRRQPYSRLRRYTNYSWFAAGIFVSKYCSRLIYHKFFFESPVAEKCCQCLCYSYCICCLARLCVSTSICVVAILSLRWLFLSMLLQLSCCYYT